MMKIEWVVIYVWVADPRTAFMASIEIIFRYLKTLTHDAFYRIFGSAVLQLRNDSTRPIGDLWRRAVDRGHGGATTRRPSSAT